MEKTEKELAEEARVIYETYVMVKDSLFGQKLFGELAKIKRQAVSKTFRGETPANDNSYLEARGAYRTALRLETVFADIQRDNNKAIEFLTKDIKESGNDAIAKKE